MDLSRSPAHFFFDQAPASKAGRQVIDTHISRIFITEEHAYKLKKPVNFGFLDYSTVEKRHHYCQEELRLNGRFSEGLYLDVVPLYEVNGCYYEESSLPNDIHNASKSAVDYVVKMRLFDQQNLLKNRLETEPLSVNQFQNLGYYVASVHEPLARSDEDSAFGSEAILLEPMLENFEHIRTVLHDNHVDLDLNHLELYTQNTFKDLQSVFYERKTKGFIRECHGDLHLNNIIFQDDHFTLFDGIEFNDKLRWIDTISEMAFLLMDLEYNDDFTGASVVLNAYLEYSGDYEGLAVLNFYKVYRAMVRAKVAALRYQQENEDALLEECFNYLRLATQYTHEPSKCLAITFGISGSGKTYLSRRLAPSLRAVHLRSDVERKRLFNLKPLDSSQGHPEMYTVDTTQQVFKKLKSLAEYALKYGFSVIVDATFLKQEQRTAFEELASWLDIPFTIIHCQAPETELEKRLDSRNRTGNDASEADQKIMKMQLEFCEALTEAETKHRITVLTQDEINFSGLTDFCLKNSG